MSSALGAVRFPDGTVKFCVYHGTSDVMIPNLYDTWSEAWDRKRDRQDEVGEPLEDVDIYSDYGGGFSWRGRASRKAIEVGFTMPFGDWYGDGVHETTDGTPDWFAAALNDGEVSHGTA